MISAIKRGSLLDRAAMGFALFGVSAPVFWLGLVALWVFWEKLGILPGTGYVPFAESPKDWFLHLILPCLVLALLYAAFYARITRGNLLETMGEDYIRTARAKGLSERKVIMKHGLACEPDAGRDDVRDGHRAFCIGGAVIIETVFNWQGVGSWVIRATFTGEPARRGGRRPHGRDRRRDPEPDRRHRLRLPRPAGAVPVNDIPRRAPARGR